MIGFISLVILVVIVILALIFFKFEHQGRKAKVVLAVIVILLVYFSINAIFGSENVDLTSPKGVVKAVYLYFGWIGNTMVKLWDVGKETAGAVGNAIRMDNETAVKQDFADYASNR